MTLDYFYGQAGKLFSFYRIPKALFQEQRFQNLSTDAKTLYGILLDRMSLSVKNEWFDKQGRVFIIFTIEDVKRALCCADNKATKLLRELENFGLIERKRRGLGKPSLVYVKNFSSDLSNERVQNRENHEFGSPKNACQDPPKSRCNKNKKSKTERNNTNPILSDNHVIFCAVNFVDHHKYNSNKRSYYGIRNMSDKLCRENGLSVVVPGKGSKGKSYAEYQAEKTGTSWKGKLKIAVDALIPQVSSFEELLTRLQAAGYEIKPGKYVSCRAPGQERFTRLKTLGADYTEEAVRERIAGRRTKVAKAPREQRGVSLLIDIENSIKAAQSKGYEQWAKIHNLKQAAKKTARLIHLFVNGNRMPHPSKLLCRGQACWARAHHSHAAAR